MPKTAYGDWMVVARWARKAQNRKTSDSLNQAGNRSRFDSLRNLTEKENPTNENQVTEPQLVADTGPFLLTAGREKRKVNSLKKAESSRIEPQTKD